MAKHTVRLLKIHQITHDVNEYITEKPEGLRYQPGQATEVFVAQPGWEDQGRPFTFTSLETEDHLAFVIKAYGSRQGVTHKLSTLKPGDSLQIQDVFGDIADHGDGLFIAGGTGITPFLPIFRKRANEGRLKGCHLLFANKSREDIIYEDWLNQHFGEEWTPLLSEENVPGYTHGLINQEIISSHWEINPGYLYHCGPPPMMKIVESAAQTLGIPKNRIISEAF